MFPLENRLEDVRPLFASDHLALVIDAVIAGNSPGSLWVDDPVQPRSLFLWDKGHCYHLAGAADNATFNQAVSAVFNGEIAPFALANDLSVFKLSYADTVWIPIIERLFADHDPRKLERVFYRGDKLNFPDWRERLPAGFQISPINEQFALLSQLANFEQVTEEISAYWNHIDDFRQRGFGFCAHTDEAIVGWCNSEYVSDHRCGIGIETIEAYEARGLATLMASAFVEHCLAHGITPHWDAWANNLPSVKVAKKVGFQKIEDYSVYLGNF